jgi:hypothetical protein
LGRIANRLTYANVVSSLALFIALGGGAYAALRIPNNSVGTKQITNRAITPAKVAPATVRLFKGQKGAQGAQGPAGLKGDTGAPGLNGSDATFSGVAAGGALSGTYPSPSIAPGAVGTGQLGVIPAVKVSNTTNESIDNATLTPLTFDTTQYDNDSMHSGSSSQLIAPIAGVYEIEGEVVWVLQGSPSGERTLVIRKNGSTIAETSVAVDPGANTAQQVVTQARLSAGDFVELWASQITGGQQNVAALLTPRVPAFEMHWLGP